MIKNLSLVAFLSCFFSLATGQVISGTGGSHTVTPADEAANVGPLTKIEFDEETFEFGTVMEGEKIKNIFEFTNTGKEPLVISNAKGSCGCTVPEWPKEPILPGETGQILVQFDSKGKGKIGGNKQSKRVTITTNTDPANNYLVIKGTVEKEQVVVEQKGDPIDILFESKKAKVATPKVDQVEMTQDLVIEKEVDEAKVLVYPNPTDGELRIDLREFENLEGTVEIYDAAGSLTALRTVANLSEELVFDVTKYTPGIYTISIKMDGKDRIAKRFVIPTNE